MSSNYRQREREREREREIERDRITSTFAIPPPHYLAIVHADKRLQFLAKRNVFGLLQQVITGYVKMQKKKRMKLTARAKIKYTKDNTFHVYNTENMIRTS
jgi:hypothetical protein